MITQNSTRRRFFRDNDGMLVEYACRGGAIWRPCPPGKNLFCVVCDEVTRFLKLKFFYLLVSWCSGSVPALAWLVCSIFLCIFGDPLLQRRVKWGLLVRACPILMNFHICCPLPPFYETNLLSRRKEDTGIKMYCVNLLSVTSLLDGRSLPPHPPTPQNNSSKASVS